VIKLTKLNGTAIVINAELLETVESTPDTIVTLNTGRKILVRDTIDEVIGKVVEYKTSVSGRLNVVRQVKEEAELT